jgi:hypothetical protein
MNAFVDSLDKAQYTQTTNGMGALTHSNSKLVDLFYKVGASRGKDLTADFAAAYAQNPELAARLALWSRDVRGGAGERQHFRNFMLFLEKTNVDLLVQMLPLVPVVGRFDDLFVFTTDKAFDAAAIVWFSAVAEGNKLAGKWAPRKGPVADRLAKLFDLTPKLYRKLIVRCSNTVEQLMCANKWDDINFSHVPSLAAKLYAKAFAKRTPMYAQYKEALKKGEAKVNASAVYPHQVVEFLKGSADPTVPQAMWNALPNYVGDASILPMVDVSGSMSCPAGGTSTTCLDVAVALGLYCSDKNSGAFKDVFLTFSAKPQILKLKGDLRTKHHQLSASEWGMNTNFEAAMLSVLEHARQNLVSQQDMPKILLVLSDMQFDAANTDSSITRGALYSSYYGGVPHAPVKRNKTSMEVIRTQYELYGYEMPKIVYWNLNDKGNTPVTAGQHNASLVSGFSPALLKAVLSNKLESFTPENVMLEAIMSPRYYF